MAWNRRSKTSRRWRHVERGSEYEEVGRGLAQCSTGPINEGDVVVIYQSTTSDQGPWVRREVEFEDGRFEEIKR